MAAMTMVESIIQTAADNAKNVLDTVESGINEFTNSQDDIVVTDHSNITQRTLQMVDIIAGTIVRAPIEFASTTPTIPNLTRARPEAYLIPQAWADLASRLEDSGLEVQTLDATFHGTVEALNITSVNFGDTYYEGVVPVAVTTETILRDIELPVGSFLLSTRQKNAGLAFVALEPENIDSYVSSNIIPVTEGEQYPIFRSIGS